MHPFGGSGSIWMDAGQTDLMVSIAKIRDSDFKFILRTDHGCPTGGIVVVINHVSPLSFVFLIIVSNHSKGRDDGINLSFDWDRFVIMFNRKFLECKNWIFL